MPGDTRTAFETEVGGIYVSTWRGRDTITRVIIGAGGGDYDPDPELSVRDALELANAIREAAAVAKTHNERRGVRDAR